MSLLGPTFLTQGLGLLQTQQYLGSSGCPANGPVSCQSSPEQPNTCCFESPGVRCCFPLLLYLVCLSTNGFASFQGLLLQTQAGPICVHASATCRIWSFSSSGTPIRLLGQMIVGPYTVSYCWHYKLHLRFLSLFAGLWPDKYVPV